MFNQKNGFANINRIFDISGAVLVVGSELSGSVEEYRLSYSLYFNNDIKRGVLFARSVTQVLDQLAQLVASYTHQQVISDHNTSHDEFNSELIARALNQMQNGNYQLASELLTGLINIQPSNIIAHRLLAESYIELRHYNLAVETLTKVLPVAIANQSTKLARLYFFLALSRYNQAAILGHQDSEFEQLIATANSHANNESDWLYKAYIQELVAVQQSRAKDTEAAINSATTALEYFNVVRCPIGTSRLDKFLSELYKIQGNSNKSEFHQRRSQQVIAERGLDFT